MSLQRRPPLRHRTLSHLRTPTPRGSRVQPGAAPAAEASRSAARPVNAVKDTRYQFMAAAIIWVLTWRVIVPGFFDYDTGETSANFTAMVAEGALFNNIIWFGSLGLGLMIISARTQLTLQMLKSVNFFLKAFLGLAAASVIWSVDSHATIARLSHILIITVDCAAVCVAGGWSYKRFQEILRPALTLILIVSVVLGLMNPKMMIMPKLNIPGVVDERDYWHGLAAHKNGFGAIASTCGIFWIHGYLSKEVNVLKAIAGLGLSCWCLHLAKSSTSWMVMIFAAILMVFLLRSPKAMRRYMPYLIGAFTIIVLLYAMAVLKMLPGSDILLYPITVLTGKDTTFTDRTKIWDAVELHIHLSPLLGTGFGAYWVGPFVTSASYVFLGIMYMYPWESHNGYLDTVNDLGYVGLICLVGYIVVSIRQSIALLPNFRPQAALYLGLIFQGLLSNLSETSWFKPDFWFIVITLATFAMARTLTDAPVESPSRGQVRGAARAF